MNPRVNPRITPGANPRTPTGRDDRAGDDRRSPTRHLAGVRLTPTGRTIFFDAGELRLLPGDRVLVDDRRAGAVLGTVSLAPAPRVPQGSPGRVLRRAEARDLEKAQAELARRDGVLAAARTAVRKHELAIKIFRAEFAPGENKILLTFSSDQRVDFRALLRELTEVLRARIDLRQVGVRDEAKSVGGIGTCGLELCCSTFLPRFTPVSIRSAKNQGLALNPAKVTGQCGRLKCCLVYEEAQYVEALAGLPRPGKRVTTEDGEGRVEDLEPLRGLVRVSFPDKPPRVFPAAEVRALEPAGAQAPGPDTSGAPGVPPDDGEPGPPD